MKIERLFLYCLLAGASLLAACSTEEMTDNQAEALPEGMYPLTFTVTQSEVVASPQTRVTDSDVDGQHKSSWTAGDQIKVTVSEGGNVMETTCMLDGSGNITAYNPQLYWETTQSSKINAWYSNIIGSDATTSNTIYNIQIGYYRLDRRHSRRGRECRCISLMNKSNCLISRCDIQSESSL